MKSRVQLRNWAFLWTILLIALHSRAQQEHLPGLGRKLSTDFLNAHQIRQCLTKDRHSDPCTSVRIQRKLVTVAWDVQSKKVTYIFSNDSNLEDDSELGVGGSCRLVDEFGHPDPTARYLDWLISPKWSASFQKLSGDTVWYVLLRRKTDFPEYGEIVGFVQSRYLKLPNGYAHTELPAH